MENIIVPYFAISSFYKKRFGTKVKKIPVTIAEDCPNRKGLKKMQTCIFCDVWGSAAYAEQKGQPLIHQISDKISYFKEKYNAENFLVYFQAYTNTFLGVAKIRQHFEEAMSFPQVKGIVVGTRPDCLSPALFELWNEFSKKTFLSVELGVQSFSEEGLLFLRRGHTARCSREAIEKIKALTNVDLGIHLIFGLPEETDEDIVQSARIVSGLPVDHVKIHNLHVLKNTPLEELYNRGLFTPLELDPYARKVGLFLQHLSPDIAVDRLAAVYSRWDDLVAPEWTRHKMRSYQHILSYMNKNDIVQGQKFSEKNSDVEFQSMGFVAKQAAKQDVPT